MENFSDVILNNNTIRMCSSCEKENNLDQNKITNQGWSLSHGICVRHIKSFFKAAGYDDARINSLMGEKFKNPCRDLSEPKNKPFVDWLKDPPQAPKNK